MRKAAKIKRKHAKRIGRVSVTTVIVAAAILAIGAVAFAVSRQQTSVKRTDSQQAKPQAASKSGGNFVTVKVAGQDVQVDGQTGQIKELTPEEARKMAAGLKQLVNKSTEGRSEVHHEDGSVSIDIEGRYQNVTVAKIDEDGNLVQACVDTPSAAAAFFGINPKLMQDVGAAPTKKSIVTRPNSN